LTNRTNMIINAVIAIFFTFLGLDAGIGGLMAGLSMVYSVSALGLPIIFWVITIYYYKRYQKDKKKKRV